MPKHRGVVFILLALVFSGLAPANLQEETIKLYLAAVQAVRIEGSALADDIRKGRQKEALSRFSLSTITKSKLREWLEKASTALAGNSRAELFVDLPVLGADVAGDVFIVSGYLKVAAEGAPPEKALFFPLPHLVLKRGGEKVILNETAPAAPPSLPEVKVRKAAFEVEPQSESSSIQVSARFEIENVSGASMEIIPVYFGHPLRLETMDLDGRPASGAAVLADVDGNPQAVWKLRLSSPLKPGKSAALFFRYSASYAYHPFGRKPVGFADDRGFLMWESFWYPRFSAGWTTIPFDMKIRVPREWKALTSGKPMKEKIRNGKAEFSYRQDNPEAPYFVWGKYVETVIRPQAPRLSLWTPEKSASSPDAAGPAVFPVESMAGIVNAALDTFGSFLPPLRLDFLRITAVRRFGGYGPSGNLLLNDSYFVRPESDRMETWDLVAHELAHVWVNSLADPGASLDPFLSEGLACYLAAKAVERKAGTDKSLSIWKSRGDSFSVISHRAVAPAALNPRIQNEDNAVFRGVAYDKGAFFFRELENLAGEDVVLRALASVLNRRDRRTLTRENFLAAFQDAARIDPVDFRRYFLEESEVADYVLRPLSDEPGTIDPEAGIIESARLANLGRISPVPVVVAAYDQAGREILRKKILLSAPEGEIIRFTPSERPSKIVVDPEARVLQSETRNDVYPDSHVPASEAAELRRLAALFLEALRGRDAAAVEAVLTSDEKLIDKNTRTGLLSAVAKGLEVQTADRAGVKLFRRGADQAEASILVAAPMPPGRFVARFYFVREKDGWKISNVRIR